jgi:hypothetical protein
MLFPAESRGPCWGTITVPVKFTIWIPKLGSSLFSVHVPFTIRGSELIGDSAKLGAKRTAPVEYELGAIWDPSGRSVVGFRAVNSTPSGGLLLVMSKAEPPVLLMRIAIKVSAILHFECKSLTIDT